MRFGTLAAAAAALLVCAGGAGAQTQTPPAPTGHPSNYYNSNPTPEEQAATAALNAKQSAMRGVTAAGQTGASVDAHAREVQARYQDQLRAWQQQQDLYRHQMEEYERRYGKPK